MQDLKDLPVPVGLKEHPAFSSSEEAIEYYYSFLNSLENKRYESTVLMEKHHVFQKHGGGTDAPENLISVSIEDHVLLHYYRYRAFGAIGDKLAYLFRISDNDKRSRLRSEALVAANKKAQRLFWDKNWQRKQGLKGGSKGGLANTEKQFKARQAVGTIYGRQVGMKNQSDKLKEIIKHPIKWMYNNKETGDSDIFETKPSRIAAELIAQLNTFKPNSIKNGSSFYKILYKERCQMYGWSMIIDTAIRSEAKDL